MVFENDAINYCAVDVQQLHMYISSNIIDFLIVQMRKEADDIGPIAELEHWKKRMAKFNV